MNKFILSLLLLASFTVNAFAGAPSKRIEQNSIAKNLLKNPGGENGISRWTASAGTLAHETTNVGTGNGALNIDFAADGNTLTSTAVAIPAGFYGNVGVARCYFKGEAAFDANINVYDGTNIVATDAITSNTDKFQATSVYFSFPSSGNIQLQIEANADTSDIYIDDCFLGLAEGAGMSEISQAEIVGTALHPSTTNCQWERTSTSIGTFSADADCPTPTVTGSASAPSTKIPGITFASLSPGKYIVTATFQGGNTSGNQLFQISDGTNDGGTFQGSSGSQDFISIEGFFEYDTAQTNITFDIQARASAGSTFLTLNSGSGYQDLLITVKRFPSSSQQAFNFDSVNWKVEASITTSNASVDLGLADVTSYTEITDSAMTLTNYTSKGSDSSVQIPCSSTNAPSGTTCSAGSESLGVSFIIPRAGIYEVCTSFTHQFNSTSGTNDATFQLVETPTNAQTISQYGGGMASTRSSLGGNIGFPVSMCGRFNFSSVGRKVVRVMYEQNEATTLANSGLLMNNSDTNAGDREAFFTVRQLDVQYPAPVINNSVTSSGDGPFRIEYLMFADQDGETTACDNTPCTVYHTSNTGWATVDRNSTGNYDVDFASGTWSSAPVCVVVGHAGRNMGVESQSTSFINIQTVNPSNVAADSYGKVICIGLR